MNSKKLEHETSDSVRIEPCFSPVWDTAIVAICLRESGVPENHPAMKRAAEWLMGKEIRFAGDWIHKNPAKVEPSGWVFEYNNQWNPDVDDTGDGAAGAAAKSPRTIPRSATSVSSAA